MFNRYSFMFTSAKYQIYRSKYLIPVAPKRSLSGYILYSNDARKNIQASSVTEASKKIGEQWKAMSEDQKKVYEEKASVLSQNNAAVIEKYNKMYKSPFGKVTARNLMMQEFYSINKNKFASIMEGNEQLKQYIERLSAQQKQAFEKKSMSLTAERQEKRKLFEIPQPLYKSLNSFLSLQRKADPSVPVKSKMTDNELLKWQEKYETQVQKYHKNLERFAKKFQLTGEELTKLINKSKDKSQIMAEKKMADVNNTEKQVQLLNKKVKEGQKRLKEAKGKTNKVSRTAQAQAKKIAVEIQKVKEQIRKKTEKTTAAREQIRKIKNESTNKKQAERKQVSQ